MSDMPRFQAATTATWPDLVDELDRWGQAGRVAMLWWRDDDAVAPTAQLDRLLRFAGEVPIGLAVIPALAEPALAAALARAPSVKVLQHGWRHANHARQGKKSEYPATRSACEVGGEIAAGRARLEALFGAQSLPVFVPPWNRFAPEFLPVLPETGIAVLSAMATARPLEPLPAGVVAFDVHLDLVAWRAGQHFLGDAAALGGLAQQLRTARLSDAVLPVGILTHHLIMDAATEAFLDRLVAVTAAHPAARWAAIDEPLQ